LRSDLRQVSTRLELRLGNKNAGKDAGIAGWKPALRGLTLGCLALLLLAPVALAQEQKKADAKPPEPRVQKIFVLKYADPSQLVNLLSFMGAIQPNQDMHALAVSATPDAMTVIEDAIKRLDVPAAAPQNIDLTVYLVAGDDDTAAAAPLPKELNSVVEQLKSNFPYKAYRLWDVLTMRTRTGQMVTANSTGGSGDSPPNRIFVTTTMQIHSTSIAGDGTIRINGLQASHRVQGGTGSTTQVGMYTDLDIKEGQKVVVGKQSTAPNQALFLVLTARVIQ